MRVTQETISGKPCTVIRRPFDAEWVREQLVIGNHLYIETSGGLGITTFSLENGVLWYVDDYCVRTGVFEDLDFKYTITILPALPRNPKPEDAPLLYRYASEGVFACIDGGEIWAISDGVIDCLSECDFEINHCLDTHGNRVEVAIV